MKFSIAILSAFVAGVSAKATTEVNLSSGIAADSQIGSKLLSNARRLEQDDEVDFTWVSGYSLKFQGCHHISQWNEEADGEDEVRIQTKRLVRFRLCPTDYCTYSDASGCDSGFGDYVIDMNTFIESYIQAVEEKKEYDCEVAINNCDCEDDDGKDDGFDEEKCEYDCLVDQGMEDCADNNPYEDDEQEEEEEFQLEEYMECGQFDIPEDDDGRRLEEEEVEYFLGPYCAEQGGSIFLGMFTDDTCTTFADSYGGKNLYKDFVGDYLPYSEESLIGMECMDCKEPEDVDEQNGGDAADEDEVKELCEILYQTAGKCESYLGVDYPNENACTYMEGIKIVRQDGIVEQISPKSNATASVFIGMFVMSTVLLGAYVYYLKTKLDRAKIDLAE